MTSPGERAALPAWLMPALVFVALSAAYGATLCPTVGPGDSGELTAVMCSWGIAHPPGFPLLSLLGNLVSLLPLPGEPALALNAMNALFAALAAAVLADAVAVASGARASGAVAGLLLGTSALYWHYALVLEVFALNLLLAALLLDLLARWLAARARGETPPHLAAAAAAVMAGVITHHTTLVLVAAPVAVAFAVTGRARRPGGPKPSGRGRGRREAGAGPAAGSAPLEVLVPALVAGTLALAPLLYLPLAGVFDPPYQWGDARTPGGLLDMLLRRDFGTGTLTAPSIVANEVLVRGESASPLGLRHLRDMLGALPADLGWPALVLAAAGAVALFRRGRSWLLPLLLFAAGAFLFYTRVNAPATPLYSGIVRPFALLPHLVLAFLAGWGLAWLSGEGRPGRPGAAVAAIGRRALIGVAAVAVAVTALRRAPEVDQRRNTFTRDFGLNFAAGMPEGAIVFSSGDYFRNTLLYARLGLGVRRDLVPVEQPLLSRPWYVDQLRRRGAVAVPPGFRALGADTSSRLRALLVANEDHPLVTVGLLDRSHAAEFAELPMGLWARVDRLERMPPAGAWAREYAGVVARWRVASLADSFDERTWEHSQGRFYPYALGSLRALLDAAGALGTPVAIEVPALEVAERWRGTRRGEYLADQADLWRRFLTDWREGAGAAMDSLVAERAVRLARASLAVDSNQVQAWQTLAAVMHEGAGLPGAARFADPIEEARVRHRILALRPGDPEEARAYFSLARSLAGSDDPRVAEVLRRAERDRQDYLRLLRHVMRIYPSPLLERRVREWDAPIGRTRA